MDSKYLLLLMWRSVRFLIVEIILGAALGFAVSIIQMPAYKRVRRDVDYEVPQGNQHRFTATGEDQLVSTNIQLAKSKPVLMSPPVNWGARSRLIMYRSVRSLILLIVQIEDR